MQRTRLMCSRRDDIDGGPSSGPGRGHRPWRGSRCARSRRRDRGDGCRRSGRGGSRVRQTRRNDVSDALAGIAEAVEQEEMMDERGGVADARADEDRAAADGPEGVEVGAGDEDADGDEGAESEDASAPGDALGAAMGRVEAEDVGRGREDDGRDDDVWPVGATAGSKSSRKRIRCPRAWRRKRGRNPARNGSEIWNQCFRRPPLDSYLGKLGRLRVRKDNSSKLRFASHGKLGELSP